MDKIHIRDIKLSCIIGIFEHERHEKQEVIINLTLHTDLQEAGRTDDFSKAVDYKSVKKKILSLVENSSHFLIEALAEDIAAACLAFDKVEKVDVTVDKPGALRFARTVAVEITREKAH